jgi:hypothetical protein
MKGVIVFSSTHWVMKGEKVLKQRGIKVKLIPTPREISTDCGIVIEFEGEKREIKTILERENIPFEGIFEKKTEFY